MNYMAIIIIISIGIVFLFQKTKDINENFSNNKKNIKNIFNKSKIIIFVICIIFLVNYLNISENIKKEIIPDIYLENFNN